MQSIHRRRGFSMIEIMIVVFIIVGLIAILLPVLGASRDSSRDAVCKANQRQVSVSLMAYAVEANHYFCPSMTRQGSYTWTGVAASTTNVVVTWEMRLKNGSYMGGQQGKASNIFICKGDDTPREIQNIVDNFNQDLADAVISSYGLNSLLAMGDSDGNGLDDFYDNGDGWTNATATLSPLGVTGKLPRVTQITQPHEKILAADVADSWCLSFAYPNDEEEPDSDEAGDLGWRHHGGARVDEPDGQINVLFVDGHVKVAKQGVDDGDPTTTGNAIEAFTDDPTVAAKQWIAK